MAVPGSTGAAGAPTVSARPHHRASAVRPLRLAAALLIAGAACASPRAGPSSPGAGLAAEEAAISAALRASTDAWNAGDLAGHLAIYVDSATFMTADGPRPGVAATAQAFTRAYWRDGRPRQALSFTRVAVRPLGPGAALSTGRFLLSGGGEPEQSGWFTLVWVRTPGGWRVVHDHSS
jgi:uncharacterized protein (TIGR02246 family)